MARIPELPSDTGDRVQMTAPQGVASIDASISPAPAQNLATAGKEFDAAGEYLFKAEDDYATLQATDALLKLKQKLLDQEAGPDGWSRKRQQQASTPEFYSGNVELMNNASTELAGTLDNPLAASKFTQRAKAEILSSQSRLLEHQAKQTVEWQTTQFNNVTNANLQMLSTSDMDSVSYGSNLARWIEESVRARESIIANMYSNDAAGTLARKEDLQGVRDAYLLTAIQTALNSNRPQDAQDMLEGKFKPGGVGMPMGPMKNELSAKEIGRAHV